MVNKQNIAEHPGADELHIEQAFFCVQSAGLPRFTLSSVAIFQGSPCNKPRSAREVKSPVAGASCTQYHTFCLMMSPKQIRMGFRDGIFHEANFLVCRSKAELEAETFCFFWVRKVYRTLFALLATGASSPRVEAKHSPGRSATLRGRRLSSEMTATSPEI